MVRAPEGPARVYQETTASVAVPKNFQVGTTANMGARATEAAAELNADNNVTCSGGGGGGAGRNSSAFPEQRVRSWSWYQLMIWNRVCIFLHVVQGIYMATLFYMAAVKISHEALSGAQWFFVFAMIFWIVLEVHMTQLAVIAEVREDDRLLTIWAFYLLSLHVVTGIAIFFILVGYDTSNIKISMAFMTLVWLMYVANFGVAHVRAKFVRLERRKREEGAGALYWCDADETP